MGSRRGEESGATAAEVLLVSGESLAAGVRLGEVEKLKSSRERRLGLRVFIGQSSATSSTAEIEQDSLEDFIKSTVDLAKLTAPDPMVRACPTRPASDGVSRSGLRRPRASDNRGAEGARNSRASRRRRRSAAIRASRIPKAPNSTPAPTASFSPTARALRASMRAPTIISASRRSRRTTAGCRPATGTPRTGCIEKLDDPASGGKEGGGARVAKTRRAKNQNHSGSDRLRSPDGGGPGPYAWRAPPPDRRYTRALPFL